MLLGKRPRPPMQRTTSMTELAPDLDAVIMDAVDGAPHPSDAAHHHHNDWLQRHVATVAAGVLSPRNTQRRNSGDFQVVETAPFLKACGLCKRRLGPGRDIYMYRLPGDYGFDPLGLGKDPAFLKWYREAELIHGRWAMAAVVGIFVGQAWSGIPWFEAGADPGAIAPFSFGSLLGTQLVLMGWVESKRWVDFFNPESQSVEWATPWSKTSENFANATGDQGYPGGKFFDPLCLAGTLKDGVYVPDTEKLERLKLAEIKHARIAMLAMLIFYFEAGQGKTPLGALGL